MRYTVILRPEARDEARAAADYISVHASPEKALRWYEGFEIAVASLAELPTSHGYAREHGTIFGEELRQIVFKSFLLIFTIRKAQRRWCGQLFNIGIQICIDRALVTH